MHNRASVQRSVPLGNIARDCVKSTVEAVGTGLDCWRDSLDARTIEDLVDVQTFYVTRQSRAAIEFLGRTQDALFKYALLGWMSPAKQNSGG